jgi:hypothetical protein
VQASGGWETLVRFALLGREEERKDNAETQRSAEKAMKITRMM